MYTTSLFIARERIKLVYVYYSQISVYTDLLFNQKPGPCVDEMLMYLINVARNSGLRAYTASSSFKML